MVTKKGLFALFASIALLIGLAAPAAATEGNSAGYTVIAITPDNQRADIRGYFDLLVQPGDVQELTVQIINQQTSDIVVTLETGTASTNQNGFVVYEDEGLMDPSLEYAVQDLVTLKDTRITIPAMGSVEATATLQVPEERFSGILLGAITVTKELSEEERSSSAAFLNKYSFVIPIKLDVQQETIEPALQIGEVTADSDSPRTTLLARVHNVRPKLMRGITLTGSVYRKGENEPVLEKTMENVAMAPNSILECHLESETPLEAGNYTVKIQAEHPEGSWELEGALSLTETHSQDQSMQLLPLAQTSGNGGAASPGSSSPGILGWALGVLGAGAVLLLTTIVLLNRAMKARRDNGAGANAINDAHTPNQL